mgnify:FL=1
MSVGSDLYLLYFWIYLIQTVSLWDRSMKLVSRKLMMWSGAEILSWTSSCKYLQERLTDSVEISFECLISTCSYLGTLILNPVAV